MAEQFTDVKMPMKLRVATRPSGLTMPWNVDTGTGTSAVIDQTNVTLGPVLTTTISLPTDASGEVVFARMTQGVGGCGGPSPLPPGIIIDDLRAE